ncbi:GIY-YIG nuclease family protein [Candidatus Azambacteria bacterium]|nr:GIY-YIG nuclease family protein [Candidatus Azambacteria bacterium]
METIARQLQKLPSSPGVYFFKNKKKEVIYVGKASILKDRVRQYFASAAKKAPKTAALQKEIAHVEWKVCESAIDALIEEARYIKAYRPKYNVVFRDDKSYLYACVTAEKEYPRIFITHQPEKDKKLIALQRGLKIIGPFTEGAALKETLRHLRRIYPYCTARPLKKPCFDHHLGKCLGACAYPLKRPQTRKNIRAIAQILSGKRQSIIKKLERDMKRAAKEERFHDADEIKHKIISLQKIFAHRPALERFALRTEPDSAEWEKIQKALQEFLNTSRMIRRVEGYDISNIGGKYAVGSMVVFENGMPNKQEYRKFKIRYSGSEPNDPKMMREVIGRRMEHAEWQKPDLIILDGGKSQLSAVQKILHKDQLVFTIAKREEEIYTPTSPLPLPSSRLGNECALFIQRVRDEAHRFAVSYHRKVRSKEFMKRK